MAWINFIESISYNPAMPVSDNVPALELKEFLPFSSVGINIGIRVGL